MTAQDPVFRYFHLYRRLVRRKLVKPLECDECCNEYVFGIGDNDQLILVCYVCDTRIVPGKWMIDNVTAVVKEHLDV